MKTKLMFTLAASALTVVALAGCTASGTSTSSSPSSAGSGSTATSAAPAKAASGADAMTASTSLGTVVVNSKGLTAYYFDADKPNSGTSACTGGCAALWPAITTTSATPKVTGITGTVGTITDPAGTKQITINGRPIYTFANDSKAGDVNGQGVQGVWYVISPSGAEVKTAK